MSTTPKDSLDLDDYKYGFSMPNVSVHRTKTGINPEVVSEISAVKGETAWMRDVRLRAYPIWYSS
jgi:hypothetical protein